MPDVCQASASSYNTDRSMTQNQSGGDSDDVDHVSIARGLLDGLPAEDHPDYHEQERIAIEVSATAYAGVLRSYRWSLTFPERWLKDGQLDDTLLTPTRSCSATDVASVPVDPFSTQPLSLDVTPELLCKISPFKCDIAPRSEAHAALIRSLDG
ncbi:cytochrome p450 [Coprinopsis cinerea AmutBmut pab1-1]|nr:cytochrome p450 [Coprinopsis cinerea AmutBmut pab1-1]